MIGPRPRATITSALEMRIERILQVQEMKAERRINYVRLGFSILGFIGLFAALGVNTAKTNQVYAVQGVIWLTYSLILLLYFRYCRERYVWWLKYFTITIDLCLMSSTSIASAFNHPGIVEYLAGIPLFSFVFWNLVTGFRLSLPAGIYSSLLTAFLNFIILYVAVVTDLVEVSERSIIGGGAINVTDQSITIVVIAASGVLAGAIGRTARNLLWRAELQSAERSRLEKEKARLGKYLSPEIVDLVVENTEKLELGGKRQYATIMFTDIRNFTPYSDSHDPEEVVRFLNRYFTRMVSIVFSTGGMLDKYIGDGLLAEYGVPLTVSDAPLRALMASLRMMEELKKLNASMKEREFGDIEIGVGIATGPVLAGNIGSPERMEYTCIGATVNSAARLERLNRDMGTNIIICERTFAEIHDVVPAKRLPPMKVTGRSTTQLYAVEIPEDVSSLVKSIENRLVPSASA